MHDPFPIAPPALLVPYVERLAEYTSLKTLPLHFHELIFAFTLYHSIFRYISPAVSSYLFPRTYAALNARTKLSWDVHVVSFCQSTLVCTLALYVMWHDEERSDMNWQGKVWGYTGASGLVQAFAGGYFLWDLVVTARNVSIFGPGMLAHAISALFVFSLGFRPFVNFYGPTFILYELSSPFLNIHWFCDKLNMTGTNLQLYNGIILLGMFFSCRLVWGTYQSLQVGSEVWRAVMTNNITLTDPAFGKLSNGTLAPDLVPQAQIMRFAGERVVPHWLAACYLASNFVLNGLNWFWFGKMIETLRSRFDPPFGTREPAQRQEKVLVEGTNVSTPNAATTGNDVDYVGAVKVEKHATHLEVEQLEVKSRTNRRKG
ncbi:TLC domain-containing protein [Massariosphaeria phaeospora]|uniref:TLC domain-containing protein n=1 Tax=Massariosphaeria phaeospora TaxID=100035 RepID=A0A7C8ICK0_9PLEO|nr:TLC domain-containing protein [Massariosphaeria phaeospora]